MSEVKSGSLPVEIRRVVTGQGPGGAGGIVSDRSPPRTDVFRAIPGLVSRLVWATSAATVAPSEGADPTPAVTDFVPAPGETRLLVLTFPPDSVFAAEGFDGAGAAAENLAVSPGLAERFEPDGMHVTPTVDYGVVLDGEIWLDLGGEETCLRRFDTFVQNGTRHAWRNRSDRPASVFVVLIGAGPSR